MDPDKPYSDGNDKSATEASGPPLKSDERFSKYFKNAFGWPFKGSSAASNAA